MGPELVSFELRSEDDPAPLVDDDDPAAFVDDELGETGGAGPGAARLEPPEPVLES